MRKDSIAHFEGLDVSSSLSDDACWFMTKNQRRTTTQVPLHQVAAAYAAGFHFNKDFIVAN
jgi:hypothetical protein